MPLLGTVTVDDPYAVQYGWNLENTGSNAYQQTAVADADMDATDGWQVGTGAGVVIALTDSGFDSDHPDLAGALWTNPAEPCGTVDTDGNGKAGDCHGWNFATNSADVDNGAGGSHGASVAGVIGARAGNGRGSAGVAPDVTIMPLVIGSGDTVYAHLGAEAIRYAADHGADVVNASWGGAFTGTALEDLRAAIAYAASKGVLVVAAAGNDAGNRDSSLFYPASYTEPNVVTVGSSTAADTMSASSAYGATSVDLFAPGNKVATTWNDGGMRVVSGTSIAAPHVAAALGLYRAAMPTATIDQLKQALLEDTDPIAAFQGRSVSGGRLSMTGLAERGLEAVDYSFRSTTAPVGTVSPTIAVSGTTEPGAFSVTLGLGVRHQGSTWAVADLPLALDGATVPTDAEGQATFSLGARTSLDGLVLAPSATLPEGRYVLTVQLTRDGEPVGSPRAAPLVVGSPAPWTVGSAGRRRRARPTRVPRRRGPRRRAPPTRHHQPPTRAPRPRHDHAEDPTPGTTDPGTTNPGPRRRHHHPGTTTPAPPPAPPRRGPRRPARRPPAAPPRHHHATTTPGTTTPGPPTPGAARRGPRPRHDRPRHHHADPGTGGQQTYPGTGTFGITSISPVRVSVTGGTEVRVAGLALPVGARVLVGTSGAATVVRSSTSEVVFRTPARVAGRYDVTVFAPDGRSEVLRSVLEYVAATTGGTTPTPGTGGTTPPPTTTPPTTTQPSPGAGSGPTPGGGNGGAAPTTPSEVTGPGDLRLVRSARWDAVPASVWSLDCSSSCRGAVLRA
ncbi:S8 family serine peptidase [Geodermatophilus normandii]|uniref:S8 family serine peptidase n=1 Tax=Geodermatophilus normandii TaxID=1137989 RepID=UPI0014767B37|nr:S8 family serine peptidase [Geodermatophilus normandii]